MLTQMCSNRAIVDSLECCMDDLVECFEDFVKKSLILIFLGIGVIVGLLCYLLKVVSERSPLNGAPVGAENTTVKQNICNAITEKSRKVKQELISNKLKENEGNKIDNKINNNIVDNIDNNIENNINNCVDNNVDGRQVSLNTDKYKESTATAMTPTNLPNLLSFDENVLHEIGLSSCSKNACGCGSHIYTPSRVPVPSLQTSSSKHKLIPCIRKRSLNKSNLPSLQICPKTTKPGSCCSMCCYEETKLNEDLDRQILYRHQ